MPPYLGVAGRANRLHGAQRLLPGKAGSPYMIAQLAEFCLSTLVFLDTPSFSFLMLCPQGTLVTSGTPSITKEGLLAGRECAHIILSYRHLP